MQEIYRPQNRRQFILFVITIAMMSMIGIVSSDVYLPSMLYMSEYFHTSYAMIQKTMTVYLSGLAIFQLIYGPIADHFGRRPTLLIGIAVYIVASVACVLAGSVPMLMVARFFQAIGACAGLVMGRCIISDIYDSKEVAHLFSIVMPLVAMSPAISPVIGGYLQVAFGWRATFGFTVFFGVILFVMIKLFMGETLNVSEKKAFHPVQVIKNSFSLFYCKKFVVYSLLVGAVYCSWFAYLANSSSIYKIFNLTPNQVGYCYMSQSLAYILGSLGAKRLINRVATNHLILTALIVNFLAAIIMYLFGSVSLLGFILVVTLSAFTNGILLPMNISSAMLSSVEYNTKLGGSASGVVGFIQVGGGAVGTLLVGLFPHTVLYLSLVMIGCMIFSIPLFGWAFKDTLLTIEKR